jgi:hypothetical protein
MAFEELYLDIVARDDYTMCSALIKEELFAFLTDS